MDADRIIAELQAQHPGRNIVCIPETNPKEIICEIEPTSQHPTWSVAIAVIDESQEHYHRSTKEYYTVLRGELDLTVDGKARHLIAGDTVTIHPGSRHAARGNETWVECRSEPGWTPEDHILG